MFFCECMRHYWALRPEMLGENAPVAQLDRAPDYESGGQEFESLRARHFASIRNKTANPVYLTDAISPATVLSVLLSLPLDHDSETLFSGCCVTATCRLC